MALCTRLGRVSPPHDPADATSLAELRARIEAVTAQLVRTLDERFEISAEIGRRKRDSGVPLRDPEREHRLLEQAMGESDGRCPPEVVRAVLRLVLDASVERMEPRR